MKQRSLISILSLGSLMFFSSCSDTTPQNHRSETPLRPVHGITLGKADLSNTRSFSGQIKVAQGTSIAFQIGGRVDTVLAKAGRRYPKGEILAILDRRDVKLQLNETHVRWIEAEQGLQRIQKLFETGNASKSQLDSAMAKEATLRSARDLAQKHFDDGLLTMPYPGVIGRVLIEPQMVVTPGAQVMSIQGDAALEFIIGLPTELVQRVNVGMEANIHMSHLKQSLPAIISEISPQASENTTYQVTLTLSETVDHLRDGMDGKAELKLIHEHAPSLSLPLSAVLSNSKGESFVWLLKAQTDQQGTVHRRPVKLGTLKSDGHIGIIEGCQTGDIVITKGIHRLSEGMQVAFPNL